MVVNHVIKKFNFPRSYYDDFVSEACIGYLQALENYDPETKVPFHHYAFHRVRGAVLDGARRMNDLSPKMYRNLKAYSALNDIRDHELQTHIDGGEKLKSKHESLRNILSYVHKGGLIFRLTEAASQVQLEELESETLTPDLALDRKSEALKLRKVLDELPEKYQQIIHMYYFEDKTFTECGECLGISKSWVSRLHHMAIEAIRDAWAMAEESSEGRK